MSWYVTRGWNWEVSVCFPGREQTMYLSYGTSVLHVRLPWW